MDGYRALYKKFAGHYEAAAGGDGDFEGGRADFHEAQGVPFRPLKVALERFWPDERPLNGERPIKGEWGGVVDAFTTLFGITLEQWEAAMVRRGLRAKLRLLRG